MRRPALYVVLGGGALAAAGVLWQAFTISAYARGAGEGALDAHSWGSSVVHLGQLAVVIGATAAWWGNRAAVGLAAGFLVLSAAQLALVGDTDERGGWVHGLHGFLALVVFAGAAMYAHRAARELGLRR